MYTIKFLFSFCVLSSNAYRWNSSSSGKITGGSWMSNVTVSRPVTGITMSFNVTIPKKSCCPALHMHSAESVVHKTLKCHADRTFDNDVSFNNALFHLTESGPGCSPTSQGNINCAGSTHIVSGFELSWRISIGYKCSDMKELHMDYNIYMEENNEGQCYELDYEPCTYFVNYTSYFLPNTLGATDRSHIRQTMAPLQFAANNLEKHCYKHVKDFTCRVFFSECKNGHIYQPCKSMCEELLHACQSHISFLFLTCSYFPQNNCYYRPVTCPYLKHPQNGQVEVTGYKAESLASYTCSEGYQLKNYNESRRCLFTGNWSGPVPSCDYIHWISQTVISALLSVAATAVIISLCVVLRNKYSLELEIVFVKFLRFSRLIRGFNVSRLLHQYHAYIIHADKELHFVVRHLRRNLEDRKGYKVCFPGRDFLGGVAYQDNIMEAVNDSACAIVLLSEDFLDCNWCVFAFEQAYIRVKEDPHFNIVTVLMHERKQLGKLPVLVEAYIRTQSYLKLQEFIFWSKLYRVMEKSTLSPGRSFTARSSVSDDSPIYDNECFENS